MSPQGDGLALLVALLTAYPDRDVAALLVAEADRETEDAALLSAAATLHHAMADQLGPRMGEFLCGLGSLAARAREDPT